MKNLFAAGRMLRQRFTAPRRLWLPTLVAEL